MAQELIYTSARKGLKLGSRGFCTVASTAGMAKSLADRLESLSGYRHVFSPGDPQAQLNPVNFSHVIIRVGGQQYHVLSRVADAGFDYTQRTNKVAHHIALEPAEVVSTGPAWLLAQPGFMETSWDGEPRLLGAGRSIPQAELEPGVCRTWESITGDAGWGGYLAQTMTSGGAAFIIFRPGMDLLPLILEAQALLTPEKRWKATFSTYFTQLPPGADCRCRYVLEGTPEARRAERSHGAAVIDLCRDIGSPTSSPLVDAARSGLVAPILHTSQPLIPPRSTGVDTVNEHWNSGGLERELPPEPMDVLPPMRKLETNPPSSRRTRPPIRPDQANRKTWWTLAVTAAVLVIVIGLAASGYLLFSHVLRGSLPTMASTESQERRQSRTEHPNSQSDPGSNDAIKLSPDQSAPRTATDAYASSDDKSNTQVPDILSTDPIDPGTQPPIQVQHDYPVEGAPGSAQNRRPTDNPSTSVVADGSTLSREPPKNEGATAAGSRDDRMRIKRWVALSTTFSVSPNEIASIPGLTSLSALDIKVVPRANAFSTIPPATAFTISEDAANNGWSVHPLSDSGKVLLTISSEAPVLLCAWGADAASVANEADQLFHFDLQLAYENSVHPVAIVPRHIAPLRLADMGFTRNDTMWQRLIAQSGSVVFRIHGLHESDLYTGTVRMEVGNKQRIPFGANKSYECIIKVAGTILNPHLHVDFELGGPRFARSNVKRNVFEAVEDWERKRDVLYTLWVQRLEHVRKLLAATPNDERLKDEVVRVEAKADEFVKRNAKRVNRRASQIDVQEYERAFYAYPDDLLSVAQQLHDAFALHMKVLPESGKETDADEVPLYTIGEWESVDQVLGDRTARDVEE